MALKVRIGKKSPKLRITESETRAIVENELIQEIEEGELEHIRDTLDKMEDDPDSVAFRELFGDKFRRIIDFPTTDSTSLTGQFISLWDQMGYDVDWSKGIVSAEKELSSGTQEQELLATMGFGEAPPKKKRKIQMKIGKFFGKLADLTAKKRVLTDKVLDFAKNNRDKLPLKFGERFPRSAGDITGEMLEAVLTPEEIKRFNQIDNQLDMYGVDEIDLPNFSASEAEFKDLQAYWQKNADYLKKNIQKLKDSDTYSIILTRHPIDVLRMADFDDFASCHSPPSRGHGSGEYYKCAVAEAHGEGAVAYVVNTDELLAMTDSGTIDEAEEKINTVEEIFDDNMRDGPGFPEYYSPTGRNIGGTLKPVSRLRLRLAKVMREMGQDQFLKKKLKDMSPEEVEAFKSGDYRNLPANSKMSTEIAVPETRVYGKKLPGIGDRLLRWVQEQQADIIESLPRAEDGKIDLNQITFFGGTYSDSGGTSGLDQRFRELIGLTSDETHGKSRQDGSVEDSLDDDLLYSSRERAIHNECEEIADEFNHEVMKYFTVGFEVMDDGGGDFYIKVSATLELSFDDFERLPNTHQAFDIAQEAIGQMNDYPYSSDGVIKEVFNYYPRITSTPSQELRRAGKITKSEPKISFFVDVEPESIDGLESGYAFDPDGFGSFCAEINKFDDLQNDHDLFSKIFEKLFKTEGFMSGGAFIKWANELVVDSNLYYEWGYDVEDSYDGDHFESIDVYTTDTYLDLSEYVPIEKYAVKWDTSGTPIKAFVNNYPVAYVYRADDGSFEVTESENMNGYYKSFEAAKRSIEAGQANNEYAYDMIKKVLGSREFSLALKQKLVGPHLDESGYWPPNWSVKHRVMPTDDGEVEILIRMEADSDAPDGAIRSMRETVEEWEDQDELRAAVKSVVDASMRKVSQNKQSKDPLSESKRIVNTWKEFLRT